jgi:hypothetical protein
MILDVQHREQLTVGQGSIYVNLSGVEWTDLILGGFDGTELLLRGKWRDIIAWKQESRWHDGGIPMLCLVCRWPDSTPIRGL